MKTVACRQTPSIAPFKGNIVAELIEPQTPRLILRRWRPEDRAPFAELNADPVAMEHLITPLTRAESDALADRIEGLIAGRGWGFWAVEIKTTGEFIGFTGLHAPEGLPMSPCVEVGWRLLREHWGQGYATEAAEAALRVGFARLDLAEIVALTTLMNVRSQAVMDRLGMVRDEATFEHPRVPEGHPSRTHCLYRLTRDAWSESRGPRQ